MQNYKATDRQAAALRRHSKDANQFIDGEIAEELQNKDHLLKNLRVGSDGDE